jgi:hypothetical protein
MFDIFKIIKPEYTKWIPLGTYRYGYTDYITMVRKNIKTGMLYFKTIKITPGSDYSYLFTGKELNAQKQLEEVLKTNN